jgi:hypothetical protein
MVNKNIKNIEMLVCQADAVTENEGQILARSLARMIYGQLSLQTYSFIDKHTVDLSKNQEENKYESHE